MTLPAYTITTSNPDGSGETDPLPFSDLTYTELLDDSWSASFKCPNHAPGVTYANLSVGRLVNVYRNGSLRWAGILWSSDASSGGALQFQAFGAYELLKYRLLLPPDTFVFDDMSPFEMAWEVIEYGNAQGGLDITEGTPVGADPHSFSVTWEWWAGWSLADILHAIAALPYVAFDYYLTADRVWHVVRRTDPDYARDPNPDVALDVTNLESVSVSEELIDTATQVLSVGADEGAKMLYTLSAVENDDVYGLLQMFDTQAQSRFGARDQEFLDFHNANVLGAQKYAQRRVSALVNLAEVDWDACALGDLITLTYDDGGYLVLDDAFSLSQRSVQITPAGRELSTWYFATSDRFGS